MLNFDFLLKRLMFVLFHNKGGPVLSPAKPTINLVPKNNVPEGDATISWELKDYQ